LRLAAAEPSASPVVLGDILQVTVFAGGEKQEDFTATIVATGTITCPLLGETKVAGLTPEEIARQLRAMLARDYFVDPQVLVSVKEHGGQVYVTGEVKQPGAYGVREVHGLRLAARGEAHARGGRPAQNRDDRCGESQAGKATGSPPDERRPVGNSPAALLVRHRDLEETEAYES
jgi:protein involved in polysaccharide export with SLBB domain